tara:strand:- start:346 stop:741 length:396 start_codon:yes stop_codon:yes gene_type:complete
MKIELKNLAPYLPYGLKCKSTTILFGEEDNGIYEMGLISMRGVLKGTGKPILRPLSDLTKEVEFNGEKFIPSDRTNVGMLHGRIYSNIGVVENRITTNTITYSDMTYLISLHFDVFGLIPQGLAIDINTIK